MNEISLHGAVYNFQIDYEVIVVKDILHILNYLMKKAQYKMIFSFFKLRFVETLSVRTQLTSQSKKRISLNNQPSLVRSRLIDLNINELCYYLFLVSLDRYDECFNTLDDLSDRTCVPSKTEDANSKLFNLTLETNASK